MSTAAKTLPPPRTYDLDSMVTLLVGPEEQRMTVHREFLGQDSRFFQAALKKEWVEGQSREIKLPEESYVNMGYYIGHMYGDKLPTHVLTQKSHCLPMSEQYKLLAELYVLGERRLDAKYQNLIIQELFRLVNLSGMGPDADYANVIYQETTAESPARRLVVDLAVRCTTDYWSGNSGKDIPNTDFWRDMSKVLLQRMAKHTLVSGMRDVSLQQKDYFVSEDTAS
jgi:hypothetical protein